MDPVVSAYPRPPDYFNGLSLEEIRAMAPPSPPEQECSTFGVPIMRDGQWCPAVSAFTELETENKSASELVALAKTVKESVLLNYLQLLEHATTPSENCLEDLKKAQHAFMHILVELRRRQVFH
ncbi:hypothetical protein PSACC_01720 [Paramicrosporidium saccamoebae]|uniref:Mediator of RNA polymerase II transcription subunit 7 n=1 Tax=Paramicrosporidium saccamoebae TaxID=1246581 RepID=A0A2H9TL53_9FUNG|nr:hypothetical protein PSACC_01720 [Paramicrosporidium saccamoebae]